MNKSTITTFSVVLLLLLFATTAHALIGGGRVQGVLKFHNKLSNYCSNITEGLNCTGSNYNENAHDVKLPLSDMKIMMKVNGVLAAEGSTDINGNYDLAWTYPYSSVPLSAEIESYLEHKDGRFRVYSTGATNYRIYGSFTPTLDWTGSPQNGTGAIQNLGTWNWGSSTTPNDRLNLYSAAWRTWYYAFKYSGVLLNNFGNGTLQKPHLKIVANSSGSTTSFYTSSTHTVTIGSTDVKNRSYQAVYHEMGHAASFKASQGGFEWTGAYNWPNTTIGGGHGYDTPEWSSVGFEEGLAEFLGVVGQYWFNAPEARTCLPWDEDYHCPTTIAPGDGHRLDTNPTCNLTNENRFEQNTTRFLWDYYDSNNEGNDNITGAYWQFLAGINAMADGTSNNQTNEPWNAAKTAIDDFDGRSLQDLRHMLYNLNSVSAFNIYSMHCSPPGTY